MIVSVVTRGVSDDCNSTIIDGNSVYLRVAHTGKAFGLHYSLDGKYWNMVRYFTLGKTENLRVGFEASNRWERAATLCFRTLCIGLIF